jgi:hypothetical protein
MVNESFLSEAVDYRTVKQPSNEMLTDIMREGLKFKELIDIRKTEEEVEEEKELERKLLSELKDSKK